MSIERVILKEAEYPKQMDWDLVAKFADGIPVFSRTDPEDVVFRKIYKNPEWRAIQTFPIDFSGDCYGLVYVKNEADLRSNPTGTVKDRVAWELTALYRDFARALYLRKRNGLNGNIRNVPVPRFSYVTAGNFGMALSEAYRRFGLPPIKLLVDSSVSVDKLKALTAMHADVYLVDLIRNVFENDKEKKKRPYTPREIKALTNNENGVDITSVIAIEPQAVFYDWHVHESFNEGPDQIFVPYGSGRLWENYLTWQERTIRNDADGKKDPRLRVPVGKVIGMSILGAEPENLDSGADKLTKCFNPFILFDDQDVMALDVLSFTGKNTGIYKVREEKIKEAFDLMGRRFDTEPSGAAGLALYLQRWEEGKVDPRDKVLVVNTGKGI